MESAELKRFRLRIVCIACAALAVCAAAFVLLASASAAWFARSEER